MEVYAITFDYKAKTLEVTMSDLSEKTYTNKADYLADHPTREDDCKVIGWDDKEI